jgi:glycosyltransferase involved in cell wall biosynthesis
MDPRRILFSREGRLLQEYEESAYKRSALVFAVSDVDARAIASLVPGVPVLPVPIAVDAAAMSPVESVTGAPEVAFIGAQDWPPNADAVNYFLSEIWPRVRAEVPDARFTVVGRGEAGIKARWGACPAVQFTGWVQDVDQWFRRSRVLIVPLRSGSGMRVKILDAFARGIPVVATPIGMEGIAAVDGQHASIAVTPDAFAAATIRILKDRDLAERLASEARRLVLESYSVRAVGRLQLNALRQFAS